MMVDTQFNIGDKCFAVVDHQEDVQLKCYLCDGKGKLLIKKIFSISCDHCSGRGQTMSQRHTFPIVTPVTVIRIYVDIRDGGSTEFPKMYPHFSYHVRYETNIVNEVSVPFSIELDRLFVSRDEAVKKAKKLCVEHRLKPRKNHYDLKG